MSEVRVGQLGRVEVRGEDVLVDLVGVDAALDEPPRGLHDLGAAAVVERDPQVHAGVQLGVDPRVASICRRSSSGARSRRPMKRTRTPCSARSGSSRSIVSPKISISASTSLARPRPVLGREREDDEDWMPRSIAASTVRRSARVPARWPAAVGRPRCLAQRPLPSMMIATDSATSGDVPGREGLDAPERPDARDQVQGVREVRARRAQTSMISASLRLSRSSILWTCSSVSFWTRPSARRSSSSPTCPDSDELLEVVHHVAAHVAHGDAALLGMCRTTLTSSLRRSSVSCGIGRRMSLPSFDG